MKIFDEQIALQSQKPREIINLTSRLKASVEKSGCRSGFALVTSHGPGTAVIVSGEESNLFSELEDWLDETSVDRTRSKESGKADAYWTALRSALLGHQVTVHFADLRLELGVGQAVLFVELDGIRPRRITIKILGE